MDTISYLLQSLDEQSLICNFYIAVLVFSLLQTQYKSLFLLTGLFPYTDNLSYWLQSQDRQSYLFICQFLFR